MPVYNPSRRSRPEYVPDGAPLYRIGAVSCETPRIGYVWNVAIAWYHDSDVTFIDNPIVLLQFKNQTETLWEYASSVNLTAIPKTHHSPWTHTDTITVPQSLAPGKYTLTVHVVDVHKNHAIPLAQQGRCYDGSYYIGTVEVLDQGKGESLFPYPDWLSERDHVCVGTRVHQSINSDGVTIQCPPETRDGDFLILSMVCHGCTLPDVLPHGWIRIADETSPGALTFAVFWKIAHHEPFAYTISWKGAALGAIIAAYRGPNTVIRFKLQTGEGNIPLFPSVPGREKDLWVYTLAIDVPGGVGNPYGAIGARTAQCGIGIPFASFLFDRRFSLYPQGHGIYYARSCAWITGALVLAAL